MSGKPKPKFLGEGESPAARRTRLVEKQPYLLAGLSGLLQFLIFPNLLHLELWPLAWATLIPLLFGLEAAARPRQAGLIALVMGLVGYPLLYHWLIYTFNHYAAMGYLVSSLILFLLVLALSAFLAAFGALHFLLTRRLHFPLWLSAPLCWVALEYLRAYFPFGGFPWAFLAYSQHRFTPFIQIAEFTGPYGVSFLLVLANAGLAQTFLNVLPRPAGLVSAPEKAGRLSRRLLPLLPALGLPLLALVYGLLRIPVVDRAFQGRPAVTVGVVQANIDQGLKWDEDFFWKAMDAHLALTQSLMEEKPALVIWPEAAVTVSNFNDHWRERTFLIDYLARIKTYFLTGAPSREWCGRGQSGALNRDEDRCWFNSAYLFAPEMEQALGRYDKIHLVPFGEYVPLKKLLFFADAIAHGNTGGSSPGREVKVMEMPGLKLGCVICYEVIFPHLVRRFVNRGADFMTTITNDAWFGKTGAPYQHHAAVIFRAVENRVYFARAANTGISSIVDPVGRVLHQTPIYQSAAFTGQVKPSTIRSFYTLRGDLFAGLDVLVCLAALFLSSRFFHRRVPWDSVSGDASGSPPG